MKFVFRSMHISALLISIIFTHCKPAKQHHSSNANLENTYWKLFTMNGNPVTTRDNEKEVHVILTKESSELKLKGYAGCNSIGGSYTIDGTKIRFNVFSTKMMCDPSRMEVENYLVNALTTSTSFRIQGETLELMRGDFVVAEFQSVYFN